MTNTIVLIAAMSNNRVIGQNNTIPWSCKGDMKHFRAQTTDNVVIMGRKTWESIGSKPLKNRINIILSSKVGGEIIKINHEDSVTSEIHVGTLDEALRQGSFYTGKAIFIIGGRTLYEQGLELADEMILTTIDIEVVGDTYFPEFNTDDWEMVVETETESSDCDYGYRITHYRKK